MINERHNFFPSIIYDYRENRARGKEKSVKGLRHQPVLVPYGEN